MYGVEAANGQCKPVERSVSGKTLRGHTFKELVVKAPFECQNICENDPRCASYNYFIPGRVCELNSKTKEAKPDDFVTDEQRFYMKRESTINCHFQFICDYLKGESLRLQGVVKPDLGMSDKVIKIYDLFHCHVISRRYLNTKETRGNVDCSNMSRKP